MLSYHPPICKTVFFTALKDEPEISRMSTDVIEYESADCGFNLKFSATYSNGKTRNVACNGDDRLTSGETRQVSAGMGYGTMTDAEIGDCVTGIRFQAFMDRSGLTHCSIGSGVTSIDQSAFLRCKSLTSCTLPSGVTSIGHSAFSHCSSLTNMVIPSGVTNISVYIFTYDNRYIYVK